MIAKGDSGTGRWGNISTYTHLLPLLLLRHLGIFLSSQLLAAERYYTPRLQESDAASFSILVARFLPLPYPGHCHLRGHRTTIPFYFPFNIIFTTDTGSSTTHLFSLFSLLGRGSMFVISFNQFLKLLGVNQDWRKESFLDLGAGDGEVTKHLAPAFNHIYVTEVSSTMQKLLTKRGYTYV